MTPRQHHVSRYAFGKAWGTFRSKFALFSMFRRGIAIASDGAG
jgi:hypothetical protein